MGSPRWERVAIRKATRNNLVTRIATRSAAFRNEVRSPTGIIAATLILPSCFPFELPLYPSIVTSRVSNVVSFRPHALRTLELFCYHRDAPDKDGKPKSYNLCSLFKLREQGTPVDYVPLLEFLHALSGQDQLGLQLCDLLSALLKFLRHGATRGNE